MQNIDKLIWFLIGLNTCGAILNGGIAIMLFFI